MGYGLGRVLNAWLQAGVQLSGVSCSRETGLASKE